MDEVLITVQGPASLRMRAVDQDGGVINMLVQMYRNGDAEKRYDHSTDLAE